MYGSLPLCMDISFCMQEEHRIRVKKGKEDMEKWLQKSDQITSLTSYRKADSMFRDEKIWADVSENDRKEIFRDISNFLSKKEKVIVAITSRILSIRNPKKMFV